MDDPRTHSPGEDSNDPDAEGVRVIGPDEAEEAMEREDVVQRLSERQPRLGDRPSAPGGPRPALRFPLPADDASAEAAGPKPVADQPVHTAELQPWTDPPTGEVPRVVASEPLHDDDLDAWSSFASSAPRWREHDDWDDGGYDDVAALGDADTRLGALDDSRPAGADLFSFDEVDPPAADEPEPVFTFATSPGASDDVQTYAASPEGYSPEGRWGDDPGDAGWSEDPTWADQAPGGDPTPPPRPRPSRRRPAPGGAGSSSGGAGRDMPTAIAVGVGFAAVAVILFALGAKFAAILVFLALAIAAAEFFGAVRRAGSQPVVLVGLVATAAFPLAVYWKGLYAFPLVLAVAFGACVVWYLLGAGGDTPVLEGLGVTLLGVVWIGVLGSFATLMLRVPDGRGMVLAAVIVAVAYDIGGLAVGRSFGSRPLSGASPNKTVEGLLGGMAAAVVVGIVIGAFNLGAFHGLAAGLELGIFAAIAAPIGDLAESLVKRDLGIKDMGNLLPGHGGMLDRIDSMLFVMPAAYFVIVALIH